MNILVYDLLVFTHVHSDVRIGTCFTVGYFILSTMMRQAIPVM